MKECAILINAINRDNFIVFSALSQSSKFSGLSDWIKVTIGNWTCQPTRAKWPDVDLAMASFVNILLMLTVEMVGTNLI